MNTLPFIYQKAIIASVEASKVILKFYEKGFQSKFKEDGSPVTEADLASSTTIIQHLSETNIPVLGEESNHPSFEIRKKWDLNWCVDPLDGTKEFIKRNGEFAVNIALIKNNLPQFGVIAWPTNNKLIFGSKDIGVYISDFDNFENSSKWKKIESRNSPNNPLVMTVSHTFRSDVSNNFMENLKQEFTTIQLLKKGSALKFFDLAQGNADIYPRFAPTMEWDIAAGQAIIEALGGTVCSISSGKSLRYNKEDLLNPHFIVLTKPLVKN